MPCKTRSSGKLPWAAVVHKKRLFARRKRSKLTVSVRNSTRVHPDSILPPRGPLTDPADHMTNIYDDKSLLTPRVVTRQSWVARLRAKVSAFLGSLWTARA